MDTGHVDYVLDAQYDYYGRRFATCSSDHSVRVWDQAPETTGGWRMTGCIKGASKSAISKISWAFPEFGQLIAVCSEDSCVTIWEEQTDVGGDDAQGRTRWICRATLKESVRPVKDVEFAPRHLGLKLAAASADGTVRFYEAVDVMNLSHWPQQDAFDAEKLQGDVALSLSWNKSRFDPPMIVVGGNGVKVWQYDDQTRKWEAVCTLAMHGSGVHDVSWAPKMGRSYHMIATAGRDYRVRVHYLRYSERGQLMHASDDVREIDAKSEVWRVEWNVTGTLLASSGDDGVVKLWKRSQEGQGDWAQVKVISQPMLESSDTLIIL